MDINHPIYKSFYNNFNKLFDKVVIKFDCPVHTNTWKYIIKRVDISVNISIKNQHVYYLFDKFSFTSNQREISNNYQPEFNNEYLSIFYLLPLEYIKTNLNYLFGLQESKDIDFRIDIDIFFEEPDKLFFGSNIPKIDISFVEVDNHIIQEHKNHWINDRESIPDSILEKLI